MSVEHTVEFMSVSSYGAGGTQQGKLQVIMDIRVPIEGKHGTPGIPAPCSRSALLTALSLMRCITPLSVCIAPAA